MMFATHVHEVTERAYTDAEALSIGFALIFIFIVGYLIVALALGKWDR